MARTKKASNDQQNRKVVKQQQSSSFAEFANNVVASTTPIQRSSTSVSLRPKDENVNFAGPISTGSVANEESILNDNSAITNDSDISGVSVLMTDDSVASSVIDLTESIKTVEENTELPSDGDQQQHESTTSRRKSIRKSLKRLTSSTGPRFDITTGRTSKGTPYIRKVPSTHRNYLANEMKFTTGKKERIAKEIKKSVNVKRVTFNKSPSMKASAAAKSIQTTGKKQSAVKIPNFNDIHKRMFEKMESIDVTVRKREERMKAASSKKENQGSSNGTSNKSKKVVRKLDNTQPGPSNISEAGHTDTVSELSKSVRSKPLRAAPIVEVLQERSNRGAVFEFTGSSDTKVVSQPLPGKKTVENRSARHQQAYKARPVPQSSSRLKGVRLNRRFELQMKYRENQNEL